MVNGMLKIIGLTTYTSKLPLGYLDAVAFGFASTLPKHRVGETPPMLFL
jgi:hypothetical protein